MEDLELLYRMKGLPCEHIIFESNVCANCEYSKNSNCKVHEAYIKIQKKLKCLDMILNYANDYDTSICIDFIVGKYNDEELFNLLRELL